MFTSLRMYKSACNPIQSVHVEGKDPLGREIFDFTQTLLFLLGDRFSRCWDNYLKHQIERVFEKQKYYFSIDKFLILIYSFYYRKITLVELKVLYFINKIYF